MKKQLIFLVFVMLFLSVTRVSAQCEFEGYNYAGFYNGHVYYVSEGNHTWLAANAHAIFLGGYLATISDAAENAFVSGIATTWADDGGEGDPGAWIGLNDIATEGSFVWSNGEPVVYTSWGAGEPNNGEYGDGNGEDWVEINRNGAGMWNDLPGFVNYIESVVEFNDADCDGVADVCDETFDDADCDEIGDGCDETFDDADCDGIGDGCDEAFDDADCDGTGDGCDNCPGGDDSGPCDAETLPGVENIPADWLCHVNGKKVFVCHNGHTICINFHAVQAHLDHGDFLGPCTGCADNGFVAPFDNGIATSESLDHPEFEVFPNPGNGDITIAMQKHNGTVQIYDQRGMLIRSLEFAAYQRLDIHLADAGVYLVRFTTDNETITKKLMVVR